MLKLESSLGGSLRLFWRLLDSQARRQFVFLLFLTTLAGFVEVVSVGLIIPFVAMASDSLPFGKANLLTKTLIGFVQALGVSAQHTTAALGILFLVVIGLANAYLCLYQYLAARVIQVLRHDFSCRIARALATRPLEWLDLQNSADLIKVALSDVLNLCSLTHAAVQVAAIATRCCVVYLFFLFTQARLALALVVSLGILYPLVFHLVQRLVAPAGEESQQAYLDMSRATSELVGGARAARATVTSDRLWSRFSEASQRAVRPQIIRSMPMYITRAGLETVTVAVVIGLLIYFNAKDGNLANGLPLLSSYAVAGIRLLPAVQQSLNFLVEIRFYSPSLQEVARVLEQPDTVREKPCTTPIALKRALELRQVTYRYSTSSANVLHGISLRIEKNARVAFVGESGAGKSTIIDIILALRQPQSGGLWVDDTPIDLDTAQGWRLSVGYVPQSIYLLDASIAENIAFGYSRDEIDPELLRVACDKACLSEFVASLPKGLDTFVGERGVRLSGGQCQRIGIARALYHNPEVVIFDEATSSLDSVTENLVLEAIDRLKGTTTLVVIAHRLNTVWDFDRLFVLEQGCLVSQGSTPELLQSCPTFRALAQHQMAMGAADSATPLLEESGVATC